MTLFPRRPGTTRPRRASGLTPAPLLLALLLLALLLPGAARAASEAAELDTWAMGGGLLVGLALFLFGMEYMGDALKAVAGERMRTILGQLTGNRVMGLLTGALVTAIIQSSSVTTVMLVGFVTADLISFSQSVGVILGADIGTTITAQVVAFKVTHLAPFLVAGGFLVTFVSKQERVVQYGRLVMGLGLVFFGMGEMSGAMKPLRHYSPFLSLMGDVAHPAVGILVGTLFTGLIQSSSATMGVVIALASQGLLTLEAGIALAFGANIGTCVTAGLAAIGKPREAVRVALAHVSFKIIGVLLAVWFIPELATLCRMISPPHPDLMGMDRLAAEVPRQVANAHTLFNVGIALVFLPFTTLFARFITALLPDRPVEGEQAVVEAITRYLDPSLLTTPPLALDAARRELRSMGMRVGLMFEDIMPVMLHGNHHSLMAMAHRDQAVDLQYRELLSYLRQISQKPLSDAQTQELTTIITAASHMESVGDVVETDLVTIGRRRLEKGVTVSTESEHRFRMLHRKVQHALELAVRALAEEDKAAAGQVRAMKAEIRRQMAEATIHHVHRLGADAPRREAAYEIEMDILDRMRRVHAMANSIARLVEQGGVEPPPESKEAAAPPAP